MKVSIVTKDGWIVYSGGKIRTDSIVGCNEAALEIIRHRRDFTLQPGMTEEDAEVLTGVEEIEIHGSEYIIANRKYDLSAGYHIPAWISDTGDIFPKLRPAIFQEKYILDKTIPIIQTWPIIESNLKNYPN